LRFSDAGFALVELLVAAAILGIAASSALVLFGAMSDRLSMRNLAYSVALSLRQAQSYGVSVRGTGTAAFDAGYGIHFEKGDNASASFVLFADKDGDEKFNGAFGIEYNESGCLAGDECLEVFRLERGNRIDKFCAVWAVSGAEECDTSAPPLAFLALSFHRPDPDAVIRTNFSVGEPERYQGARIYLVSPRGATGQVEVGNTGQISVK
jgi:prepilin-type N-terminal cleavage/methylation domain-containing protein